MNESAPLQAPLVSPTPPTKDPGGLGWLLSGLVLPLGSRMFYRVALRKSPGLAVLFFFIFTTLITLLTTISVTHAFSEVGGAIERAYQDGTVPAMTIHNGIAEVDGPQPNYLYDDPLPAGQGILIAVDTTGRLTEIDRSRYSSGFLITRTEMHSLDNNGREQRLGLDEINAMFGRDPLVIDARSVATAWTTLSGLMLIFVLVGLWLWNFVFGLMLIAVVALVFWGLTVLIRPGTQFGPVLIAGLYALVPAFYLGHLMSRSGLVFPGMQTLMLIPIWVAALVAGLSSEKAMPEQKPRLWTALIGLPLLIAFVVDVFWRFPEPWGLPVLWALFVLTVLALILVRLLLRTRAAETAAPA